MRLKQWVKNAFVLAPLIFANKFSDISCVSNAFLATFLFCIASSATYILNDYHDIEQDKKHPKKSKTRPLASGQIQKSHALILLSFLYIILIASASLMPSVLFVIGLYLIINIAYSVFLKHQVVVDIFTIAFGFVLRIYAGATAINVPVSAWMFVTTLCLALYLATIKRQQELKHSPALCARSVLQFYTPKLLERYAGMSATGTLLFYSLFVMTAHPNMVITIPIVLFGLFRYWFISETDDISESPTDTLFADWQLAATVLLWIIVCLWRLFP